MKDVILKGLKLLVWIVSFPLAVLVLHRLLKRIRKRRMGKHKKTFYDVYCELWELLDKPKLRFWQRMRTKQLLNQLLRMHENKEF